MDVLGQLPSKLVNPFKQFVLDDAISRLNRIYLFVICILAGVIINVKDYAGEKISCHGFTIFSAPFAENYCWVQGIYVILEAFDIPADRIPYPGIIPEQIPCLDHMLKDGTMFICPDSGTIAPLTRVQLMWYQWIPFYFFLCAAALYAPYVIYHASELGKLKVIGKLLTESFDDEAEESAKLERASLWLSAKISTYIKAKGFFQCVFLRHRFFLIILFSKLANLAVVALVLITTNLMFEVSSFLTYGSDWLSYIVAEDNGSETNPVHKLFPKMAACEVKVWGTTGIVNEAGMCVLAPNVVNSYIFIIFWFLLMISLAANLCSVLFTTTSYLFTLGMWKALLARTFMDDTAQGKWLYFKSGMSGQISLEILAKNLPSKTFEKLFVKMCSKVVRSASKETLAELQEVQ